MANLVHDLIAEIHASVADDESGELIGGIPALESVDPDRFAICVATADGHVYEVGDTREEFLLQSISKPFTYALALDDRGLEAVDEKIDVEPSGELYNEISLDSMSHRPRNPMINAGALVAASMVRGEGVDDRAERIRRTFSLYAGRELAIDEELFAAQLEAGHRNRAIGHMLREFEILDCSPDEAHEVYLKACSTAINCCDLSLMGATLSTGGTQPQTGERVLSVELTERVLSVMATCGMYDAAGAWVAEVGLAAKSGVSGGIVAVLPGQLAIAAFSPRLDRHGNSVRAFRACRELSKRLGLHTMHVARGARSAIRDSYDILEAPSFVHRPDTDRRVLEQHGRRARIYELHGDLLFSGAESVVRELCVAGFDLEMLVLDVRRVGEVADVARDLLGRLHTWLREQMCEVLLVDPDRTLPDPEAGTELETPVFPSIASATAHIEDRLLERHGDASAHEDEVRFAEHPAIQGLPEPIVAELESRMTRRRYEDGETLVAEGDSSAGIFLVTRGRVRSSIETTAGARRDLATLTPGTWFGDTSAVTANPHPRTMRAIGTVEALELTREQLARLEDEDPELEAAILRIFIHALHDDFDRILSAMAHARVVPMTAS